MVKTLFQASTWNALEAGSFDGAVSVRELLRCAEHTISLRQTECRKTGETVTAAVYEYLVDNDGEWGELRFDFENGTAEIVKLADWDTVRSNIFAKTALRYIQGLPEARLLKSVVVPFEIDSSENPVFPAESIEGYSLIHNFNVTGGVSEPV